MISLLLLVAAFADWEPGQRVIVDVSRGLSIPGFVVGYQEGVLEVRDLDDALHTFNLQEVSRVVRLIDGGADVMGTVIFRTGQQRHGAILQDDFDEVVFHMHGALVTVPRSEVSHVVLDTPFEERYAAIRDGIDLNNLDHRILLVEWLVEQRRLELASDYLAELPLEDRIARVQTLERQIAILHRQSDRDATAERGGQVSPRVPCDESAAPGRLLTEEEVNLIRVYEIDLTNPPRIRISPAARRLLLESHGSDARMPQASALMAMEDLAVFRLMRQVGAQDLYGEVVVLTEPDALLRFGRDVHDRWLMPRCGTRACHGGSDGGTFRLRRLPPRDARARYANLLMLERFEVDPAWPLVNYDLPMQSLAVQYALPRHLADHPHPDADGWQAALRSPKSKRTIDSLEWIASMQQVPRPEYPIVFPEETPERVLDDP
jgi:hypothetical protein